ncbi:MAG TPA: hypothetical protein VFE16_04565 [Candidatus Cybelea sp.]|nr:hypothetical protein [Candidatus Cybelea sp.]
MLQPSPSSARRFGCAVLLGATVAGCSMNSTATTPSNLQAGTSPAATLQRDKLFARGFGQSSSRHAYASGWIAPDAKKKKNKPLIYWGSYDSNTIDFFSAKGANPPEKGQITAGLSNPERLVVDKSLNVYATNLGNDTITGYKRGATAPFLTISDGVNTPTGLTVDAAGTVYCANVGNDTITEYPKGKTKPSLTIEAFAEYLATDTKKNLYAAEASAVYEFAPGSANGTNLNLSIGSPGALAVDKHGNIIVIDESTNAIDVFPAGKTQPSKTIQVPAGDAFGLSLNKSEKSVYVTVLGNSDDFVVQQLPYPKGTSLTTKISGAYGEWPIAASPDAP